MVTIIVNRLFFKNLFKDKKQSLFKTFINVELQSVSLPENLLFLERI